MKTETALFTSEYTAGVGEWREPMSILIWASCEASRDYLYSQGWAKIKPGKMPEEILNRFDTNYIVLLVWKCTLLESLTIITLNYKLCKRAHCSQINAAIVCVWYPLSIKMLTPLIGLEATSSCPCPLFCPVDPFLQALYPK